MTTEDLSRSGGHVLLVSTSPKLGSRALKLRIAPTPGTAQDSGYGCLYCFESPATYPSWTHHTTAPTPPVPTYTKIV